MKNILIVCCIAVISAIAPEALAQHQLPPITIEGRLNYPVVPATGGRVLLQLIISTKGSENENRKPMNLSIVLDRSGSMGDQHKLQYAKEAFRTLIRQMRPDDILSVVAYDDQINVLRESARVGTGKHSIVKLIDEIEPGGSTNLGGGLREGLQQVEINNSHEYINRVILLSDGLANVGITDPYELNQMAKTYRQRSISVTTMGIGLDYNENLMMGLAESGGGNYYFIEHPSSLADIVRQEMSTVSSVLVQNSTIRVRPGNTVRIDNVIGYEFERDGDDISISLGDLYTNDHREITVEMNIPKGTGSFTAANGELTYKNKDNPKKFPEFVSKARYSKNKMEVENRRDLEIQAKADVAVSTQKIEQAMEAMDHGNTTEADRHLSEAQAYLQASPAASASGASGDYLREQIIRTNSYRRAVKDTADLKKVKKSIQYDNYQTQKQK